MTEHEKDLFIEQLQNELHNSKETVNAQKVVIRQLCAEKFAEQSKEFEEDRNLTPLQRYENMLRCTNETLVKYGDKPMYTEEEIQAKVKAEKEYYEALQRNELHPTGYYLEKEEHKEG